jgi:protein-S-isoprenylcysteine O-methyltransferase Ste14
MDFLNYFQIGSIVIVVCVVAIKVAYSWAATGVIPIAVLRGQGKWRIVEFLSFLAVILWVVEVLLLALPPNRNLFPLTLKIGLLHARVAHYLGVMLVVFGMIPFLLAYINFGTSWRIGIDRKTPGTLVTEGIFAVTRNPIYVAFILFFFGFFLINGTWFFLIFALLAVVAIHFQILREEEFLQQQYGLSYADYSARTARYLIW